MAHGPRYSVPFRRRSEGKTDYKLRSALLRSGKPRAIIRSSNKYIYVQLVEALSTGDIVKSSASSKELNALGWKGGTGNLPAAYLTGVLAGRRAVARGITDTVLDLGLQSSTKGSKLYAALKGLLDGGIALPHSGDVLPSGSRLSGGHIANYGKVISSEKIDVYKKRFSAYLGRGLRPEDLPGHFEQVKESIQSMKIEV